MKYTNSNIEYKYQKSNKFQESTSTQVQKKKKRKTSNKAKEVKDWDDMPKETSINNATYAVAAAATANTTTSEPKQKMTWVKGTIPMKIIKKMKWGDLNELTDEEYGYFKMN
tara:strand:- start:1040 stop:1375 length:336 start_codon:yes stop_codon:yes gene_type:complete